MALPRTLKNFNLFNDGTSFVGLIPSVTLPKLTRKMEDYRAGGMNGPIKSDQGIEALTMEWTAGGYIRQVFEQWGATQHDAVALRFAGALQADDTGAVTAVEVFVRGRHSEIDPGESTAGEKTEVKVKSELSYYRLEMDGRTIIEIDVMNLVEVVGGVDRLAEVRAAIGL